MKTLAKISTLILAFILIFSCFTGCKNKDDGKKETPKAEFLNQTKMFKQEGFSIIMDVRFEYQSSADCAISCVNGDLTFEAFYLEKYYFTEKNKDIDTPKEALQYVNQGRTVTENKIGLPFVEYQKPDSDGVNYTFYYVCVEDSERYWMCAFFAPTSNFEGYREHIESYLDSIEAVFEEE